MRRYWIVSLLALWVSGLGCSSMTTRDDGTPGYRPGVFSRATAPPQTQVVLPPEPSANGPSTATADRGGLGLSRYFPGLNKGPTDDVTVASTGRTSSWFGLRKAKPSQVYTTDARVPIGKGGAEPSLLPVALQVPTADQAVTTTSAEVATPSSSSPASDPKPADPATDELPAAAPPAAAPAASPILDVTPPRTAATDVTPPVAPGPEAPAETQAVAGIPAQPQPQPQPPPPPQQPPVDPRERPRMDPPSGPPPAPPAVKPDAKVLATPDVDAVKADAPIDPTKALTLPTPTMPASYLIRTTATGQAASPQNSGHVHVHPSAQATPSGQSGTAAAAPAKKWRRPCLRRLVRRVGKLGEFANPPTAAPH